MTEAGLMPFKAHLLQESCEARQYNLKPSTNLVVLLWVMTFLSLGWPANYATNSATCQVIGTSALSAHGISMDLSLNCDTINVSPLIQVQAVVSTIAELAVAGQGMTEAGLMPFKARLLQESCECDATIPFSYLIRSR
jgi:hypothetical protein